MWPVGRLSRDKRGAGSIVGGVFIVLIFLSGFTFYLLNANTTDAYNRTLEAMNQLDWERSQEEIMIKEIAITGADKLNVTVKNEGSIQIHLIYLGVFNETSTPVTQLYYSLDEYLDPDETATNIGSSVTVTSGSHYIIQLVTERGNTIDYDLYPLTITGPDTIPYYKTSADWRSYTIKIPSAAGASVPTYFTIYANGSSVAFNGITNPDWVPTNTNGEYTVQIKSTKVSGETFILYVEVENLVGQKTITQEPKR